VPEPATSGGEGSGDAGSPRPHRPLWRRAAKPVFMLAATGAGIWAVSGKTDELSGATSYFDHLHWTWIAVAVVVEFGSYVAYANLQRRLLRAGGVRAGLRRMTSISFAGNSIQNSLPAGVVVSAAFAFRQYRRFGADDVLCSWVIVAMTGLSMLSLTALAVIGLAMAASTGSALDLAEVIIGTVVVMAAAVLAWHKRSWLIDRSVSAVRLSQRLIHRPKGVPDAIVADLRTRLGSITPSRTDWSVAATMAAANWILDMTCLAAAFMAVGADVPWRGLLLAYAAAQLASNLPITPGGLGVVEGSLTIALVAFGGAEASTVAAVLVYRLFSFWLTLPIGWGSWGMLSLRGRRLDRAERGVGAGAATFARSVEAV
jgi:uncharacterized protein (TIRG00374 family)